MPTFTYSFTIETLVSDIIITDVFVISKESIMVTFSGSIVDNRFLKNVNNYVIVDLSGGSNPVITGIVTYSKVTNKVIFEVDQLVYGHRYQFKLLEGTVYDTDGNDLVESKSSWLMRFTKTDNSIYKVGRKGMNGERGSILRAIMEALMISDERIGGDF